MTSLCKHWNHKLDVELGQNRSIVRFEDAVASFVPTEDHLQVTILGNDVLAVKRLENVVQKHIDRFAFREAPLHFDWQDERPEPLAL
jgi:hypothetical protein